jgi:tetratricopeptide (TPR) repeat protein
MADASTTLSLPHILQQAAQLLAQRRPSEAESLLRPALLKWADQPDLLKLLGSAREQFGDLAGAEQLYRAALQGDPKAFAVATQLGHILRNQRRHGEAVEAFRAALSISPSHVDAFHGLAVTLHHAGRLDDALAIFDRAIALAPGNAGLLNNRGLVLGDLGRRDEALTSFSRAIGLVPNFVGAIINRGVILHSLERYEEALKNHDRALSLDPANAGALTNRGVTLQQLGRNEEALASFEKALSLQPGNVETWLNHGITLDRLKRTEEALASCDRALDLKPDHAAAWNNRGTMLQNLGRLEKALEAFDKAVAISPNYTEAWSSRGVVLTDLGRPAEALESLERALAIDPGHERALRNKGLALFESHRIGDGLATLAQITLTEPRQEELEAPYRQKHDAEQVAWLQQQGSDASLGDGVLHIRAGGRLSGPAVNLGNPAVTETWRTARPQVVVIDDFLTPEAMTALREFCLGSTVWRRTYEDGYLGAMPEQGFSVPLLAQVAEELRLSYPEIFRPHPLRYLWAFKYDSSLKGTAIHADQAAVNVNFWITPDDANLDPESGGLVVWDVSAPLDWDFESFNCDEMAIRDFLARNKAKPIVIPYRANRAVIFDSDLFHETDKIVFKDGYENRRINITLLYGRRHAQG